MSTSDQFRTFAQMDADQEFIQEGEVLKSGALASSDGWNRAFQRLSRNNDALLDAVLSVGSMVIAGGGNLAWNSGSGAFTRSADITIKLLNEVGGASHNTILSAAGITLAADGAVAYVVLDRASNANVTPVVVTSMANFLAAVQGQDSRLDYVLIAYRDGNGLVLWDGRRVLDGETLSGNGFTDTQYGQQSELTLVHGNQKEDRKILLTGGGSLTWDLGTNTLAWSAQLTLSFPSSAGNNRIPTGNATIAAGQFLTLTLTRTPGSSTDISGTSAVVNDGSVATTDDVFILAHHDANDGRIYLWDGTALSDGDSRVLGGVVSGVQFLYDTYGSAVQVDDLTEGGSFPSRTYYVGTGALMVYRNGIKAKRSTATWAGSYPTGSLTGSIATGDDYVEEDAGGGQGTRIIWLADGQAASEPLYHPASTHTIPKAWPQSTDWLEAFVGIQGEGPSPVESLGIYPEPGGGPLEGDVKWKAGTGVTLAYDVGNNAIEITVTAAAGVASLEASGGVQGAQTAALVLAGGTNVTLDDTSAGTITINGDVQNLPDLADMTSGISDGLTNAPATPSSTNPFVTSSDVTALVGFEQVTAPDMNGMTISRGVYIYQGNRYPSGGELAVSPSDAISGDVPSSGAWAYLYLGPGASPGDPPIPSIGATPPSDGYHPTETDHIFLSSVYYIGSTFFCPFVKIGGWVTLGADQVDITHVLNPATAGTQDLSITGSGPETIGTGFEMTMFATAGASADFIFTWGWSIAAGLYRKLQVNLVNSREYTFDFKGVRDYDGDVQFRFGDISGIASIDALYLRGYSEHSHGNEIEVFT